MRNNSEIPLLKNSALREEQNSLYKNDPSQQHESNVGPTDSVTPQVETLNAAAAEERVLHRSV